MAQGIAHSCNQRQTGLLHRRIHAQDTALVVERMEQPGQIVHIVGDLVGGPFCSRRFNQFLIIIQLLDQVHFNGFLQHGKSQSFRRAIFSSSICRRMLQIRAWAYWT